VGVISCRISACYFPLPLVPSRRGRGKFTFYEFIIEVIGKNGFDFPRYPLTMKAD
jgi:hypothetical protein